MHKHTHTHTLGLHVLFCWLPYVCVSLGASQQTLAEPGPSRCVCGTVWLLLPWSLLRLLLWHSEEAGVHHHYGLFFMYRSLEYIIFTSCNLRPLRRVILYCNVGWYVKGSAVHRNRQQCLVAEWLGLARAREWDFSVLLLFLFFFLFCV